MAIEYIQTLTLSLTDAIKMQDAQHEIYDTGIVDSNPSLLKATLTAYSTILGFAFTAPTPVAVSAAVAAVLVSLGSDTGLLETIVKGGYFDLGDITKWMRENTQYDLIKVKVSFLDYTAQNIRFVEHTGINDGLVALHVKNGGGWITA
ncbi:MAG: hypothetical protein ACI8WT_005009 [Clostridium sp.]|jgi:hypothetical protein